MDRCEAALENEIDGVNQVREQEYGVAKPGSVLLTCDEGRLEEVR